MLTPIEIVFLSSFSEVVAADTSFITFVGIVVDVTNVTNVCNSAEDEN